MNHLLRLTKLTLKPITYTYQHHPLFFNVTSCGIFGFAGDYFCQWFEHHNKLKQMATKAQNDQNNQDLQQKYLEFSNQPRVHNYKRSLQMALAHMSIGPFLHYWYRFLDKKWPGNSAKIVAKKCFYDYCFAIPYYCMFFGSLSLIRQNRTFNQYTKELSEKVPFLLVVDAFLWPTFQSFNFYFLPPSLRVIGTKVAELFFDFLVSYVAHNDIDLEEFGEYIWKLMFEKKEKEKEI